MVKTYRGLRFDAAVANHRTILKPYSETYNI